MKKRRTSIFVVVIVILSAAIVLFALFGRNGSVETPPVVLPTAVPGSEVTDNAGDGVNSSRKAEVTPKTVQAVIARLNRTEIYSRTVTVEDFWNGGNSSSATELSVWVGSGGTRIRVAREGGDENILLSGEKLWIWYDGSDEVYTRESGGGTVSEADSWLRCLTYEDLLKVPVSSISDAGYIEYGDESCVYAQYLSGELGYRSVVYVSVETGLLMGAETYDGDTLTYRMTSGAPDISAPDGSYFEPPLSASSK